MGVGGDGTIAWSNNEEKWEEASFEFDIAIDEERFDDVLDYKGKDLNEILKAKNRKEFIEKVNASLKGINVDNSDIKRVKIVKINASSNPQCEFWTFLFLSKKIRSELQKKSTDYAAKKLDWLVDFLIRWTAKIEDTFHYLLILLELSACTVGEQSLGFSEKAKDILKELKEDKKLEDWRIRAYRALIHYNQGVAKAHMHQLQDALEEYNKAIKEFGEDKIDNDIWYNYVYYPSLLQKADALTKMQFSYNALKTLEEIENANNNQKPTAFKKARKKILEAFCYTDISDLGEFDKHFKKINKLKNKGGDLYFKEPSVSGLDFLNPKSPQDPKTEEHLPWLLGAHYNSLVIGRANEDIRKKINENCLSSKELVSYNIFSFIEKYMGQCEDNRFERLTLKETVLDYMKLLKPFIDQDLKDDFNSKGPIFKTLNRLMKLLNGPDENYKFSREEIDPEKKPPIHPHVIDTAQKVLEDINDKILEKWFEKNVTKKLPKELPQHLQTFFNFESELIEGIKKKRRLSKKYDQRTLEIRGRLLEKIVKCYSEPSKIRNLENQIVCICDDKESIHRDNCLRQMLNTIKVAVQIRDDDDPKEWEILQIKDYDKILGEESERFHRHIAGRSIQPVFTNKKNNNNDNFTLNYVGLRRWNSFTPELSFSVGGGYFVFLSDNKGKVLTGIAVDPGFDFIRNFFRQGFSLTDIDLVLLTHGHPDHIRDFPAIIELLHEQRRLPKK